MESQKIGRYQIEVFPHPAMIHLFQLSRILKYKKGNLAEKKAELQKLQPLYPNNFAEFDSCFRFGGFPAPDFAPISDRQTTKSH
jgi:predicted RNase H-like nuclease